MSPIRVLILTVSDTAFKDRNADKSGPIIQKIVEERGFVCVEGEPVIVPDVEDLIREFIQEFLYNNNALEIDWIITTGGTGFGVRDRTPEVISSLIERHAPGLVHLMMSASLKHTPLAALSRPVAGTIQNALVVTLPGSVKAVKENLEALLSDGIIEHAIDLIRGGSGKRVHASLALESSTNTIASPGQASHNHHGHHHSHSHHPPHPRTTLSHDPLLPVSARHRVSPYENFSFERAMDVILNEIKPLRTVKLSVNPALKGHILAEDVLSPQNVPSTKTTSVDGYAVRSSDPPGVYQVVTSKYHDLRELLPDGYIYRINTGGSLPAGTDAVIMVEDTHLVSTHEEPDESDEEEEKEVKTLTQIPSGENVRQPGSDVRGGDLVLQKGEIITSLGGEIGTLAFIGRKEVKVYSKPIVALMSTGNEIIDLQSQTVYKQGWVFDTNRPSLQAALEGMGYDVVDLNIIPDNVALHVDAIREGLDRADIILTTGGTSMGPTDLLKPVIERHFDGTVHFGRVTIKPGKPTTFATVSIPSARRKPIFALPGNPASALVTFYIFVVPALRKLGGWPEEKCQLPRVRVQLQNSMKLDPRTEFHRVVIRASKEGLTATSTGGQRSSRVASLSGANGLVVLPPRTEDGPQSLQAGDFAEAVIIGEIQM